MREMGQFNTELKLFKETLPPVKTETLMFHRWLAEKQNKTVSRPVGDLALAMVIKENKPIEEIIGKD